MSEEKTMNPPYLSVPRFETLVEKISKMSLKKIDKSTLETFGITGTDTSLGLAALRFLGIITEDGYTVAEIHGTFQTIDKLKRAGAISEVIKVAYKELFEMDQNVSNSSKDDITQAMMLTYKLSPRVARGATPVFIYLCEISGLREADEKLQRRKTGQRKQRTTLKSNVPDQPKTPKQELVDTPTATISPISGDTKQRILEGAGWRVTVQSEFTLSKEVKRALLDLEETLEDLANNNNEEE